MKRLLTICEVAVLLLAVPCVALAGQIQVTAIDRTPTAPLPSPSPSSYQPRYISGFGSGDSFTLFFEDRSFPFPYPISFINTTSGPTGFPALATPTNITDTHFCVKDWPIDVDGTTYAYRAWGARENIPEHYFYVSNNLKKWRHVSTFTIPNFENFHSGYVYYGFHDVIQLNGKYYAWGECNIGHTLVCRSVNGDDAWEAFARVGGIGSGPLQLPAPGTPTGCFFDLGGDRGYGKIMVAGDDLAFYLAINTAAKSSLPSAQLETAFINPDNWTWHDGTTDYPAPPILEATDEHDLRECWLVSSSDNEWTIIYDADFGTSDGGKALGYAILSAPPPCTPVDIVSLYADPLAVQVDEPVYFSADIEGCVPVSAEWNFGDNSSDTEHLFEVTHSYAEPGVYTVTLNVTDAQQHTDQDEVIVVVYAPVTGGGWIDSPLGAYTVDPTLTGRANFGFVSRYKKGATVPTGNTEFIFRAGNLNFHNSSYEWLVVNQAGTRAQFKGSGTINGTGDYKFMLRAGDGEPDTFWIQIWEEIEDVEVLIYDNGSDQPIGGGNIIVHKGKK